MVTPTGWKEVRLGDLGPLSKGVGIRKNEVTPYGIPCVRYGQIYTDYNFVIGEIQTFVSPQVASNSRPLRKGEILFAGSGETKEDIGKCIAYVEDVGAVAGGDIVILTPEGADSRFLGYSLNSPNVAKQKMSRAQGDAVVHISAANLASIVLDLPPLKEQEEIAEALSDADAAIESLDALIAKKRDVKQATMQQLLAGRTRLPGFTADWTEARLGEHASMRSGGTPLTSVASFYGGTIPWASISDMSASGKYLGATDRYITEAGLASSPAVVFPEGVLLYAMYASIGECCISVCPMATSQAILGIKCANDLSLEFLYYTMQSKRAEIARSGQQGTQANLNAQMVRETMFLMPPLMEQVAIAEALTVIDDELEALTEQVSKLRMVKEGMMQDLLTGKVRLV